MYAASLPFMRVLIGTITAPALWVAIAAKTHSFMLGAQIAILSPLSTPILIKFLAISVDWASNSA